MLSDRLGFFRAGLVQGRLPTIFRFRHIGQGDFDKFSGSSPILRLVESGLTGLTGKIGFRVEGLPIG